MDSCVVLRISIGEGRYRTALDRRSLVEKAQTASKLNLVKKLLCTGRRIVALSVATGIIAIAPIAASPPATGQTSSESALEIEAEIEGAKLAQGAETPVKVVASEPTRIRIVATNKGSTPRELSGIRFEGKVIGIPVFRCDVIAPILVPPGQSVERSFEIEPACLRDQATGLVPAWLTVNGPQQIPLRRWALVLDIKGSLKSIYGLSGLFIVVVTLFALASLLAALVRQKLPSNRFSRAMRFMTVGLGVGFSLVFVLASAAVMVPEAENWIPIVVIPAIVSTVAGYLSPSPQRERDARITAAESTQLMPQPWLGPEKTGVLPQAAKTYPAQPLTTQSGQPTPETKHVSGAETETGDSILQRTPTSSASATVIPPQTTAPVSQPRFIPTKKVRPASSVESTGDTDGGEASGELTGDKS
ncbi:MAG: hypothetical protein C4319_07065 [Acidimicrobiia bacterium]